MRRVAPLGRPVPRLALVASVLPLLAAAAPLSAGGAANWGPVTILDPRPPLEIGAPLPGVDLGGPVPFAVLSTGVPELRLARVDIAPAPPTVAFTTIQADGSIFALGSIAQLPSGRIGGSYVDNFDLKFFSCHPPCNSVTVAPIGVGPEVWIDSASASAGTDFFVAGVDNTTGGIRLFRSGDGGLTWSPLRSINPAGGVYRNFDGGERLGLAVDSLAPNALTANHCVFFERLLGPGDTEKRINCGNGANFLFAEQVATDVPNAQGQPDKFIENRFLARGNQIVGVFDRRADQVVRLYRRFLSGGDDQITIATPPVGTNFFSYGLTESPDGRLDVILPVNSGVVSNHQRILLDDGPPPYDTDFESGPVQQQGPNALSFDGWGFQELMWTGGVFVGESGGGGLGIALYPVALFADGFNTGAATRWSSTLP